MRTRKVDRECIVLHPLFTSSHGVSKQSSHRLCGFGLCKCCDVSVSVEREASRVVTQHPGDRFDVHAVLQSQGCKCVSNSWNSISNFYCTIS